MNLQLRRGGRRVSPDTAQAARPGGAVSGYGGSGDWQVQLPAPLQDYRLQVPPQADELARASFSLSA